MPPIKTNCTITAIYHSQPKKALKLPFFLSKIAAGFPSPADDYIDSRLDLNEHLISHPEATFFLKVSGHSMINAGIHDGDTLIVDRSISPENNSIVIAVLNGELTVKRFCIINNEYYLVAENPEYTPIKISGDMQFEVWGVVIHVIHSYRK